MELGTVEKRPFYIHKLSLDRPLEPLLMVTEPNLDITFIQPPMFILMWDRVVIFYYNGGD